MKRLAILLLLLCATAAHAGNAVVSVSVRTHRSLASVAVMATVSGDDDTTATLRLFNWWETTGQDDSGMVMVRRVGTNIYHGRILWMTPGRTANFYVEANDGGTKVRSAQDTVSCSQVRPNVATGPVMYVSKSGNDGTCTGAIGSPCLTITKGLEKLAASTDSGAYGGVIVAPGEYHERVDLTFGRDGKPRFLSGNRANRDSTIICGANEHGEAGRYAEAGALSWTARAYGTGAGAYPSTAGVYMAYIPDGSGAESDAAYGDSIGSVVIGWGEYLHRKTSLYAVFQDSTGANAQGTLAAGTSGEPSGWWWGSDTLYVKRRTRATPSGSTFHFGYRNNLIAVAGRNWSVRNLTVRYGGGTLIDLSNGAEEDPGTYGNGIVAGQVGGNASGLVVDSCLIYGNAGLGVYAAYSDATIRCDSATVANSVFDGLTIGSMAYAAAKGRTEEDANACKVTGSHSNVYRNVVRETSNGYQTGPTANTTDSTFAYNTEVYGNTAQTLSDDAYELDTTWGVNQLVMANTADYSNSGVSVAPIYEGPLFIFYNTFTRFKSAGLKIGGDPGTEGLVRLYQNTFASEEPTSRAYEGESGGLIREVVAANNILVGREAFTMSTDTTGFYTCGFNYNLLDSAYASSLITRNSTAIGYDTWQENWGQEADGVVGEPLLMTPYRASSAWPRVDARLTYLSPAYGAGRKLPGINSGGTGGKKYWQFPNIGSQPCGNCGFE